MKLNYRIGRFELMKNYIKPTADVIEMAVKESLSARVRQQNRTYNIRGNTKTILTNIYTSNSISSIDLKKSDSAES